LVYGTYSNFGIVVTNLWTEYRVRSISVVWTPTSGLWNASVFIPGIYVVAWKGTPVTTTVAAISAVPYHKVFEAGKSFKFKVPAPPGDPENFVYGATTAALPALFGIVAAWNSGPVTATITYGSFEVYYELELQGRKV